MQIDFPGVYLLIPLLGILKIAGWLFIRLADKLLSVKGGAFVANFFIPHGAVSVNFLLTALWEAQKDKT